MSGQFTPIGLPSSRSEVRVSSSMSEIWRSESDMAANQAFCTSPQTLQTLGPVSGVCSHHNIATNHEIPTTLTSKLPTEAMLENANLYY